MALYESLLIQYRTVQWLMSFEVGSYYEMDELR